MQSFNPTLSSTFLQDVRNACAQTHPMFVLEGDFKLTKAPVQSGQAKFIIDRSIEDISKNRLFKRISESEIVDRYNRIDNERSLQRLPTHLPVKLQNREGLFNKNENVFMYFPYCIGKKDSQIENHFSLEFIEVSRKIFDEIIEPACQLLFQDKIGLSKMFSGPLNVEIFTYLFSLLHEAGHMVGPWRATPNKRPELKIHWKSHAILGELSADLLIAKCAPEVPELSLLNLLGKIFFYGRMGLTTGTSQGLLNEDNDTWGGVYLFSELIRQNVFKFVGKQIYFDLDDLMTALQKMSDEIEALGEEVISRQSVQKQEEILSSWMDQKIPKSSGRYTIPKNVLELYDQIECVPREV